MTKRQKTLIHSVALYSECIHRTIVKSAHLFCACLIFGQIALSDDHDHPPKAAPVPLPSAKPPSDAGSFAHGHQRPSSVDEEGDGQEGCVADPEALQRFANGERFDFKPLVTYLTSPACQPPSRQIAQSVVRSGVSFGSFRGLRLEDYARSLKSGDLEAAGRVESELGIRVPSLLKYDLATSDLLPVTGQLALLSPKAGRSALAALIRLRLVEGDRQIQSQGPSESTQNLARALVSMGAGETLVASELVDGISEMAIAGMGQTLVETLRPLAFAATLESRLVPTFNLATGALNQGVQRAKPIYSLETQKKLLAAVFETIRAATPGVDTMEAGSSELNEAFSSLANGKSLTSFGLKSLWIEAMEVLGQTIDQPALANAVALSLSPQVLFVSRAEKERLLQAARNYPQIAGSLQNNFSLAWERLWEDIFENRLSIVAFNRMKLKYFEPWVQSLLDLDVSLIDNGWLTTTLQRGLIADDQIESKFPRFVLSYVDRRDRAARIAENNGDIESVVASITENMAVTWALNHVYMPALLQWVERYDATTNEPDPDRVANRAE